MPFVYDRLQKLLEDRHISMYRLKKEKVIGGATIDKLQANRGNIDTRTLERLCSYLHAQPGEIMEYIEPAATGENEAVATGKKNAEE